MSTIPTKEIDGDVTVGRNVTLGGDAELQGSVRIGHDLKVEGWLEAKNIKSANKGLFTDKTKLNESFPRPHDGWFAGVSAKSEDFERLGVEAEAGISYFVMYVGEGGEWVPTNKLYEIVVDNEQVDNLRDDLSALQLSQNTLSGRVDAHDTTIGTIQTTLTSVGNVANSAKSVSDEANQRSIENASAITQLRSDHNADIKSLQDQVGEPEGIAPLDEQGKVPLLHLPVQLDDVVEFNALLSGITVQMSSSEHKSSDAGCMVVYNESSNTFVLAVVKGDVSIDEIDWSDVLYGRQSRYASNEVEGGYSSADFWEMTDSGVEQIVVSMFNYYNDWADGDKFGEASIEGRIPESGKIYTCTSENKTFKWCGSSLVVIGSDLSLGETLGAAYPGDKGKQNADSIELHQEQLDYKTLVNCHKLFPSLRVPCTLSEVILALDSKRDVIVLGTVITYKDEEKGWSSYQFIGEVAERDIVNPDCWKSFGNGSSVGNCYNVTAARMSNGDSLPTSPATYDTKQSAIEYAIRKDAVGIGVQITFAASATTWQTYQYIGLTEEEEAYANLSNWIDVAGQSAGDEAFVNINLLCKNINTATIYTLSDAIASLTRLREDTNIDYVKAGMVMTYKSGEGEWETKQLIGGEADYTNPDAWVDFGGGGNDITAEDAPEKEGTNAFSTGGAYKRLITNFVEGINDDGTEKTYQAVNANNEAIGDPISIPLNQGGGGSSTVSSFRIVFENNPLYAAANGNIIGKMAARSYTQEGEEIVYNKITNITIIDATTGLTLSSKSMTNENSSSSLTDFKFDLDFTDFFDGAGSREFTVRVTDQEGNKRSQNLTVIAVDVTVEITKSLNECIVSAGSGTTTLDNFYRFEKNALKKDGGIDVVIEMKYEGEWHVLGEANITDTFSKSISITPSNLFGGGEAMSHGSYLLRIHGYAPNAKVSGNYVYTSIMCIDATQSNVPVVAIRYDAKNYDEDCKGEVALYDNVVLQVAAYTGASVSGNTPLTVYVGSDAISMFSAASSQVYKITYQVQGYSNGDNISFKAVGTYNDATGESDTIVVVVSGSAIDVVMKDGAAFGYDFALRTNSDTDKSIEDNGIAMEVTGANWSSNGFCSYLGENALRIAENVTAKIPYRPFNFANAESSGVAIQFAFATNNIKDADAMLMHCYDPGTGTGFYVKGNVAGIYCAKGEHTVQERKFRCGEKITMAVVVEPSSIYRERGGVRYSCIKMYLNGEEVACIGYTPGQSAISQSQPIMLDGTEGDFYLYYIMAYQSHYEWAQAFNNYLAKLTDVSAMMEEFESEDVLSDLGVPSLDKMKAKKMAYYVIVAEQSVFDSFDGDTDTSVNFSCTLYYFNPEYPCLNFKATKVRWRRQGTTSAKRPVKNDRFYLSKASTMELLNPDDSTELGRYAIELAALKYTLVRPDAIPVQIITVKVDYSDSSNANDCGVCDMMNATFKALGSNYQTPAQRAFDGTFTKGSVVLTDRVMNHSTRNHPIAVFRATSDLMTDATFWAKGNWKEDKGEQVALGFMNTPGYNLGCVNYGDFVEWFGAEGETLAQACSRFLMEAADDAQLETHAIDTSKLYLISQYCGRDYAFYKYVNGAWAKQTGSMKQVGGKWQISGTVLNPVSGYELLSYQGFCWWMGVSSVADMMQMKEDKSSWVQKLVNKGLVSASKFPAWTAYFECMIDDDQLQIDLALGKKVPYDLYRMLKFCNDTSYASGVDAHGYPVEKTGADEIAWKQLWSEDLWKYASAHSLYAYTLFTDYLAATDQRAKNMQPMFFLEDGYSVTDGVYSADEAVRMYLNKVYDCDTCNGKDNDGGCTVDAEVDPNKPGVYGGYTNPYSGWGSILFNNVDKCPTVYLDASHSVNSQLTLKTVCAAMRTAKTTVDGVDIVPFSPEGAQHFFVEQRLKYWKKLISSYDSEHKYIESVSTSDAIYFYALQGLGLTALPQFIEQRWRIRDGYYQTGNFFSGVLSGRIACSSGDAAIRIKAAKTGYFGIGHDASGQLDESVFLEAGEEYEFTQFSHTEGALLYIYQADRMSEIDLSEISIDGNFNFSVMKLVEKIVLGGEEHIDVAIGSYTAMSAVMLGNLPFLRELDLRNTTATSVDASGCPRIERILAEGSVLTSCTLAQTSPIGVLTLPATMTELQFINLPNLSYPGGLSIEGLSNVTRLMVSGCSNIDSMMLIDGIIQHGNLKSIGLRDVNITASVEILRALKLMKAFGLDENGNDISADKDVEGAGKQCSGLTGRWILSELIEEEELEQLRAYFRGLGANLFNSQYSVVCYDDAEDFCENITNLDNNTGYQFNNDFVASGHFKRLEEMSHGVRGIYNSSTHEMEVEALDDENYNFLADGTSIDLSDQSGLGYDFFKHVPSHWYKGINDYKNQRKYSLRSVAEDEPISTASRITRAQISTLLVQANAALVLSDNTIGNAPVITLNASNSVYAIDVEGMKQVRWPGINSDVLGCVFVGADGNIISTFKMGISNQQFDYMAGEDYLFCDVPVGAVRFMFTTMIGCDAQEAIAVDSSALEAIEPDWVYRKEFLVGIYGMGQDGLSRARSISNTKAVVGTGTDVTSGSWTYDSNGVVTNMSVPASLNLTRQDCINLCEMRGEGFHAISYEQSKDLANIIMELTGTRDIQAVCGRGCSAGYTTGTQIINGSNINALGNQTAKNTSSGVGNLMFGIQNFVACDLEWMAHVAVNVKSFLDFKAKKCPTSESSYPVDARWHIYDVQTDTEREVQGINLSSAYCIGRIRHGRYMDYVPSKMTADNSQFNKNYSDAAWYTHSSCRVVGRASHNANAYGGLVYSNAVNVSSYSHTNYGSRLAFSGRIVWRKPS